MKKLFVSLILMVMVLAGCSNNNQALKESMPSETNDTVDVDIDTIIQDIKSQKYQIAAYLEGYGEIGEVDVSSLFNPADLTESGYEDEVNNNLLELYSNTQSEVMNVLFTAGFVEDSGEDYRNPDNALIISYKNEDDVAIMFYMTYEGIVKITVNRGEPMYYRSENSDIATQLFDTYTAFSSSLNSILPTV